MLRERCRESQHAAATILLDPVHSLPIGAGEGDAVVLGQRLIEEGVIRIHQLEHAAIVLEEVDVEASDFLLHRFAERLEGREVSFALLIERGDIANMQVLATKLGREPADSLILEHATCLRSQHIGIAQLACGCDRSQFIIRLRGPEEVTQPRGEFPIIDRTGLSGGRLAAIQERWRGKNSYQHQTRLELAQASALVRGERPAPSFRGEVEDRLSLSGLCRNFLFAKLISPLLDRRSQRFKLLDLVRPILRGVLVELFKGVHQLERLLADEQQLGPQSVEFFRLLFRENQSAELIVFAVEQCQGDDLVDRDDSRVTQRDREEIAELIEAGLEPPASRTAIAHDDRHTGNGGRGWSGRLLREYLGLQATVARFFEPSGDDKLGTVREGSGNLQFDRCGSLTRQRSRRAAGYECANRRSEQRVRQREVLLKMFAHLLRQFGRRLLSPVRERLREIECGILRSRLAEEVPRAVRISGENVRGNIRRQIPRLLPLGQSEIHRCQVARVVPVARADDECHDLIRVDSHILKRAERDRLRSCRNTRSELLGRGTATHFQRPGDTVAALGVGVRDRAGDRELVRGDRAFPGDHGSAIRGGMRGDAVRFHHAGNSHASVRGVRQHTQVLISAPSLDEVVVGRPLQLRRQQRFEFRAAETEVIPPACEEGRIDLRLAAGQYRESGFGGRDDPGAVGFEVLHQFRQLRDRKIGPPLGHQTRIVPDDRVARRAIARVPAHQVERVVAVAVEFDPEFLLRHEQRYGFLPRSSPIAATGMEVPDVRELP